MQDSDNLANRQENLVTGISEIVNNLIDHMNNVLAELELHPNSKFKEEVLCRLCQLEMNIKLFEDRYINESMSRGQKREHEAEIGRKALRQGLIRE